MYKYIAQFKKCLSSRDMPRWRKTLQVGWSFIWHESSSDQAAQPLLTPGGYVSEQWIVDGQS